MQPLLLPRAAFATEPDKLLQTLISQLFLLMQKTTFEALLHVVPVRRGAPPSTHLTLYSLYLAGSYLPASHLAVPCFALCGCPSDVRRPGCVMLV
eukprot:1156183-Pelagomonas_calceolata.AAC.2